MVEPNYGFIDDFRDLVLLLNTGKRAKLLNDYYSVCESDNNLIIAEMIGFDDDNCPIFKYGRRFIYHIGKEMSKPSMFRNTSKTNITPNRYKSWTLIDNKEQKLYKRNNNIDKLCQHS